MIPELNAILFGIIAGLATIAGIAVVAYKHNWALRYSHYVNSFAAGALLAVAFVELLPKSLELYENALLLTFVTFIAFYLLESVMVLHSGAEIHYGAQHTHGRGLHQKAQMVFAGLLVHSLIDGIIIGVGFEVSTALGLFTAMGVILHELPEGVTSFSLLLSSKGRKIALTMSLTVALATPFGALVAILFATWLSATVLGALIAVAGGSFLYVAASDLIPETHELKVLQNAGFFLFGVVLLYLLSQVFG